MTSGLNLIGFDAWGDGPSAAACRLANVSFRTWYSSSDPSKDAASASALAAYAGAGIWSIVNFENNTNDYTGGYAAGVANFNHAVAEYKAMGMPEGASVILSVDESVPVSAFASVLPYFQGAKAAAAGKYLVGCYGEQALIAYLKANGVCDVGWRTMSTSFPGGSSEAGCDIVQTGGGLIGGVSIDWDTNTSDLSTLGCWKPGQLYPAPAAGAGPTSVEDDISMLLIDLSDGVYLLHNGQLHHVTDTASLSAYMAAGVKRVTSPAAGEGAVSAAEEASLKVDFPVGPKSAPLSAAAETAAVQAGVQAGIAGAPINVQAGLTQAQMQVAVQDGVDAAAHDEGQKL